MPKTYLSIEDLDAIRRCKGLMSIREAKAKFHVGQGRIKKIWTTASEDQSSMSVTSDKLVWNIQSTKSDIWNSTDSDIMSLSDASYAELSQSDVSEEHVDTTPNNINPWICAMISGGLASTVFLYKHMDTVIQSCKSAYKTACRWGVRNVQHESKSEDSTEKTKDPIEKAEDSSLNRSQSTLIEKHLIENEDPDLIRHKRDLGIEGYKNRPRCPIGNPFLL